MLYDLGEWLRACCGPEKINTDFLIPIPITPLKLFQDPVQIGGSRPSSLKITTALPPS